MTSLLAALRNIPRINVSELVPKTFSFANPLGYSSSLDSAESAADVTKLQPQPMKRRWEWLPVMANHQGPRNTIVLCHGLGFFDKTPEVLPRFQLSYWGTISDSLRKIGSDVIVARVPSTGTIAERARALHEQLDSMLPHGAKINFVAHSMGGLDCRHLITHIVPKNYSPISLTTLSCPHRGSPFMDWCRDYLGLGRVIPKGSDATKDSTFSATAPNHQMTEQEFSLKQKVMDKVPLSTAILTRTMLARTIDCPAYANLTTAYCNQVFNPMTPDSPDVKYFSFAASAPQSAFPLWHPLYLPHQVVSQAGGTVNDGLVSVESAKWGQFVDTVDCDHWELRGRGLPGAKFEVDEFYQGLATYLYSKGF